MTSFANTDDTTPSPCVSHFKHAVSIIENDRLGQNIADVEAEHNDLLSSILSQNTASEEAHYQLLHEAVAIKNARMQYPFEIMNDLKARIQVLELETMQLKTRKEKISTDWKRLARWKQTRMWELKRLAEKRLGTLAIFSWKKGFAEREIERVLKDKLARDRIAKERELQREIQQRERWAAKEKVTREKVARENAAREDATRQSAAKEQASKEQAARDQVAREKEAMKQCITAYLCPGDEVTWTLSNSSVIPIGSVGVVQHVLSRSNSANVQFPIPADLFNFPFSQLQFVQTVNQIKEQRVRDLSFLFFLRL